MPIITSIKPQKNKKRVNIYLDNKFGFGLDIETFMKLGLKVGMKVKEDEVAKVVKKSELQIVYDKILRFAALRPRSKKELDDWLKKHKVHKSLYKELFNRLKRIKLLDDVEFAKWWIEQRISFRPKSKRILNYELRIKGIDKDVIKKVLTESKIDELSIAKKLIEKRKYRWDKLPKLKAKKKTIDFLMRKGFSWSIIKEVIKD